MRLDFGRNVYCIKMSYCWFAFGFLQNPKEIGYNPGYYYRVFHMSKSLMKEISLMQINWLNKQTENSNNVK